MSGNDRTEARSVILRLRRYRDRMQEITALAAGGAVAGGTVATGVHRQIRSLKTDLANDAHECVIGRKRMVQTVCEHDFLWPALQEAAAEIRDRTQPPAVDAGANAEVSAAQARIQHYLTQLEDRWPTL